MVKYSNDTDYTKTVDYMALADDVKVEILATFGRAANAFRKSEIYADRVLSEEIMLPLHDEGENEHLVEHRKAKETVFSKIGYEASAPTTKFHELLQSGRLFEPKNFNRSFTKNGEPLHLNAEEIEEVEKKYSNIYLAAGQDTVKIINQIDKGKSSIETFDDAEFYKAATEYLGAAKGRVKAGG